MSGAGPAAPPKVSPLYDPRWRSIAFQVLLCAVIVWLAYSAITNAADNLAKAGSPYAPLLSIIKSRATLTRLAA